MKQKIIVFGSNGKLGKYFVNYLYDTIDLSKFEIFASGIGENRNKNIDNDKYFDVDITKFDTFQNLPTDNVKAVIDFAGILPAYSANDKPELYIDINIKGTLNILKYCYNVNAERIMYMQTWADLNGYLKDKQPLKPLVPRRLVFKGDHAIYAISKSAAVDLIEHYHQQYGINNYIFRLPNIYLYSPEKFYYVNGEKKYISYRYMIDRAINGEDIELWGNPILGKDIVYIKDLCQMIYKSIFTTVKTGVYNVGTGIKTTMQEQIEGIIEVFSPKNNPSKIIYKPEKPDCDDFVMDISNAKEELGYEPKFTYKMYLMDYKKELEKDKGE